MSENKKRKIHLWDTAFKSHGHIVPYCKLTSLIKYPVDVVVDIRSRVIESISIKEARALLDLKCGDCAYSPACEDVERITKSRERSRLFALNVARLIRKQLKEGDTDGRRTEY